MEVMNIQEVQEQDFDQKSCEDGWLQYLLVVLGGEIEGRLQVVVRGIFMLSRHRSTLHVRPVCLPSLQKRSVEDSAIIKGQKRRIIQGLPTRKTRLYQAFVPPERVIAILE